MKLEMTVEDLARMGGLMLAGIAYAEDKKASTVEREEPDHDDPLRDIEAYPALEWQLNMATGRLTAACDAVDGSLSLYEVWHNGDDWLAMRAHVGREPLATGSLTKCLDACQEHFMDAVDADRNVANAAGQVS